MERKPYEVDYEEQPLSPVRRAIAQRVTESMRQIPSFSMHAEVDASALVAAREQAKAAADEEHPAPTYNDYLIKIVALALREHPRLNAHFVDGAVRLCRQINISVAAATAQGVLMPTVLNADQKSLAEISAEMREMLDLARRGKLRASLQLGGTFSLSNIGPGACDSFNAIISPPQVAILAVGALAPRPFVVDGRLEVRPTLRLTLTVDHRAIDGADGAPFLAELKERIARVEIGEG